MYARACAFPYMVDPRRVLAQLVHIIQLCSIFKIIYRYIVIFILRATIVYIIATIVHLQPVATVV
nr:MAG TPA: hypothetical protein [Caudoviricetes sp.]